MRRIVWIAVGAAGGIYAYRRGAQVLAEARERGVVLSAQQAGLSAVSALNAAKSMAAAATAATGTSSARGARPLVRTPGAAAALALAAARRPADKQESGRGLRRDP
ncbi:MAG: hypothetical protein Q7V58_05745 [Actinomycetota bacterium]|nr:hypothetical protein [Actinomycetota bacterium]